MITKTEAKSLAARRLDACSVRLDSADLGVCVYTCAASVSGLNPSDVILMSALLSVYVCVRVCMCALQPGRYLLSITD